VAGFDSTRVADFEVTRDTLGPLVPGPFVSFIFQFELKLALKMVCICAFISYARPPRWKRRGEAAPAARLR
jgi:hypothetical protein